MEGQDKSGKNWVGQGPRFTLFVFLNFSFGCVFLVQIEVYAKSLFNNENKFGLIVKHKLNLDLTFEVLNVS